MTLKACLDMTPLMNFSRYRGIGGYCLQLARALARLEQLPPGLELHLLVGDGVAFRIEPCNAALIEQLAALEPQKVMAHSLYYLLKHTAAWARLSLSEMDLYHSSEPKGTSRPLRCKRVLTCHDLIPVFCYPYRPWKLPPRARAAIERARFVGVDHVIAISRWTRDDLQRIKAARAEQISVVYHGVDSGIFNTTAEPGEQQRVVQFLGSDRPYFLSVGGFDYRKQIPALIEAFCRQAGSVDQDLVLCGQPGKKEWRITKRYLSSRVAKERIICPGYVPAELLPALYRGATTHVLSSRYEGFGMTITEAFACGCPVIALRASCIPEVAGDAALLVDDAAGLEGAMTDVATDRKLRDGLRREGLQRAKQFTWARTAQRTVEVYSRVLGG